MNFYPLRNERLFTIPICRTNIYANSFIPSTLKDYNELAARFDLTNITSLYQFKQLLRSAISDIMLLDTNKNAIYINAGDRKYNILLCQLRNSSSNLNSDLYRDHLLDSPACVCGNPYETVDHFFLNCNKYDDLRETLQDKLFDINHNHYTLDILLSGCDDCDEQTNLYIFECTADFVRATHRFPNI